MTSQSNAQSNIEYFTDYKDAGEMWRSRYETENLEEEAVMLWFNGIYPLYNELHKYVHNQLKDIYGYKMKDDAKIPAHLLGNMWAQTWVFYSFLISKLFF